MSDRAGELSQSKTQALASNEGNLANTGTRDIDGSAEIPRSSEDNKVSHLSKAFFVAATKHSEDDDDILPQVPS